MNISGKYHTIVADPPWKVSAGRAIGLYQPSPDGQKFGVVSNSSRALSYPTMSVDEVSALPVADIAYPDAHLYLWTINKYLHEAFHVMRAWGFTYSTTLIWAKNPMGGGLGGCYGLSTEFCLFGRRGTLPATSRVSGSWFNWKRPYDERGKPRHSAKPAEFFRMVETVSPGPRIELFARELREGWTVWGNEVAI